MRGLTCLLSSCCCGGGGVGQVFNEDTSNAVMAAVLIHDVQNPNVRTHTHACHHRGRQTDRQTPSGWLACLDYWW